MWLRSSWKVAMLEMDLIGDDETSSQKSCRPTGLPVEAKIVLQVLIDQEVFFQIEDLREVVAGELHERLRRLSGWGGADRPICPAAGLFLPVYFNKLGGRARVPPARPR